MGLTITDIVIEVLGVLFLLGIIVLSLKGKKYDYLFEGLDSKNFQLKEVYSIGYALLEMVHFDFQSDKSKTNRKLRQQLRVVYEEKYVEYYLRVVYAKSYSLAIIIIQFAFILYGLSRELGAFCIFVLLGVLIGYRFFTETDKIIEKRSEELLIDFSDAASNLALLTNAGMILREAWEETTRTGNGLIYKEMERAMEDMRNGVSDAEAVRRFGVRCMIPEVKKFSSTLIQGMEKGNKELSNALRQQSAELWELKKQLVKRQGETAASKLLLPMFVMFGGILVLIVVPIFGNMGM